MANTKNSALNQTAATEQSGKKSYKKRSVWQETWRRFKKNPGAMVGLAYVVILVLIAVLIGFFVDYDSEIIAMNTANRYLPPSLAHPFGCDNVGRDVFLRVLYGARYSLIIGVAAILIATVFGFLIGTFAAYKGGKVEAVIMRITDVVRSVPSILLAITLASALGQGVHNLILAVGIGSIAIFVVYTRAAVLSVRNCEYIEAARAIGATDWDIIRRHIMPNSLSPIIVQITMRIGGTIIAAAGLSFVGLGVPLPTPEWGAMLSEGRTYIQTYPWMTLFPGLAILLTVIAFNLVGDGIRDAMDPKLKN